MGRAATQRIGRIDDAALLVAAAEARNLRDLLQTLGLAAYGGNDASIRSRLAKLDALSERFRPRPTSGVGAVRDLPAEHLRRAVEGSVSLSAVLRWLGVPPSSSAYAALRARRAEEQIDASGLGSRAARPTVSSRPRRALAELLVAGGRTDPGHLKGRLLREGVLLAVCASCGIEEWQGKPAPLELDHVNGDRTDNQLSNLRLLCSNCHAQTPTYRGRNIGRGRRTVATEARVV